MINVLYLFNYYIGMYVFMYNSVLLCTTGKLLILFAYKDLSGIVSVQTTFHPDRYEWVKRLPDLSYRHITSTKTMHLKFSSHDEGYYCAYLYQQEKLLQKTCFKVVILGKHLKFVLCL